MPKENRNSLKRSITLFQATLYGIGLILGAGIYVIIGDVASIAGNTMWISFVIAALMAIITGLSYARLASIYPNSAAEYFFIKNIFSNKFVALIIGFLIIYSTTISASTVAVGFSNYFFNVFQIDHSLIISVILLLSLSAINYYGISESIRLNIFFTFIEIGGLFVIIIAGIIFGNNQSNNFYSLTTYSQNHIFPNIPIFIIMQGAALAFFAYFGFENIVNISDETINPKRTIPLSILLSIIISSIIYIAVALTSISLVGSEHLSKMDAPLAIVVQKIFGTNGSIIISIIALFATFNTALMMLISSSRIIYGISADGSLPLIFSKIGIKRKTPWVSIFIVMLLTILMIIVFLGKIETLASMAVFSVFVVYSMVNFSLIWKIAVYKNNDGKMIARFKSELILPFAGLASITFLIIQLPIQVILWGIILMVIIIFVAFFVYKNISKFSC